MIGVMGREEVAEQLSAISSLSRAELIARWVSAHGRPPPKGFSRRLLEYSAAYRLQVKAFGGLKPNARRKLRQETAPGVSQASAAIGSRKSDRLSPGARLVREWHGRTYTVEVIEGGFRCDGETYTSLSQIAHAITGTRWSGPRFFGL